MPLSKKRERLDRMSNLTDAVVKPKQAWEIIKWASVDMGLNPQFKAPIPDGRRDNAT